MNLPGDQDLPGLNKSIVQLPSDLRADIAERLRWDLFPFANMIGMKDLNERCHGPVSVFLNHNKKRFKVVLMPRDHLKTSLCTVAGGLQLVTQNPEHRISIVNAVGKKASNMLLSVRSIVDSNKIFRTLYSGIVPKNTRDGRRWNVDGLDFVREGSYPDPTISAYGMSGTMTSSHFTHQIFDDPIEEEAYQSPSVMADAITRMSGMLALMDSPTKDSVWLVGTRWAIHDVYGHFMEVWGDRCAKMIRSIIEDGEVIFPEKMGTIDDVAFLRQSMTEYRFSCWYLNSPRDEALQTFNVKDIRYFKVSENGETLTLYDPAGDVVRHVRFDSLDVSCAVDLAPAERGNDDRNAITTVGVSPWGDIIVLDAFATRGQPSEVIEYLFTIKQRFAPRVFGIEDVAYQKAFKWFLREEAKKRQVWFNVQPVKAIGKKDIRIEGLQPLAANGRLYVHPRQQELLTEASQFPLGKHDDLIDSLSMHQQLWQGVMDPDRLREYHERQAKVIQEIMDSSPGPQRDPVELDIINSMGPGWNPQFRLPGAVPDLFRQFPSRGSRQPRYSRSGPY